MLRWKSLQASSGTLILRERWRDGNARPTKRRPVLQIANKRSDSLVTYGVRVYLRNREKPLRETYVTIIEPDGELHTIRVSEAFGHKADIERIETTRVRHAISRIDNVPVRVDLLPGEEP